MKKIFLALMFLTFAFPLLMAINLNVEQQDSKGVIINGVDRPAVFNVKITNLGESNNLQFYNLLGFSMAPKGTLAMSSKEVKNVSLLVYPRENFNYNGFYSFKYFIRGQDKSEISQDLTIKFVDIEDMFEIGSGELSPETSSMKIYIYNRESFDFDNLNVNFDSPFFKVEENITLSANEKKEFDIQLNREDFKKLMAGFYTLNARISAYGKTAEIEGVIKFVEKDILTTTSNDYGLIISTDVISKKNEGNVIAKTETVVKKNIISRLFTSFSPEPDSVDRQGLTVYYTWIEEISPGDELEITVRTNWILPLISIIFIILAVIVARIYATTNLAISKKVSFVKAKGGEFALKVSLIANARSHVERVNITDWLPPLVKVHERFGVDRPKRIDDKSRKIEWEFEKLDKGETRVLTYIIYSKIGVVGKFALPTAMAVYEKDGKIHESESNKTFFVAEQRSGDVED